MNTSEILVSKLNHLKSIKKLLPYVNSTSVLRNSFISPCSTFQINLNSQFRNFYFSNSNNILNASKPVSFFTTRSQNISSTFFRRNHSSEPRNELNLPTLVTVYKGPLSKVVKLLKFTAVSSIVVAGASIPWFFGFFGVQSKLSLLARVGLISTASVLIGSSSAFVNWAFKAYITKIGVFDPQPITASNNTQSKPELADTAANLSISAGESSSRKIELLSSQQLLLIGTLDFIGRDVVTAVRINSLKRLDDTPLRTWTATCNTELTQAEIDELSKVALTFTKNKKILPGNKGALYYVHLDMDLSKGMRSVVDSIN
ncbi:hypothetical protein AYI69_g2669 [Smittium culicis]|uniref:Transmembrane protein n=1 Tax=Smittium culicis TaxID=133412 RepID=A0A1R1YLU1_9FUNG|nr:hypothetical protein AYI69_g2669 [Smittium culicis]